MNESSEPASTPAPEAEPASGTLPDRPDSAVGIPQEERTWAMLSHLSALAGYVIPFGSIIGPLVVWLIKKDTMPFVDEQGKESLNFQITVAIAFVCCIPLVFIIIGIFLIIALGIVALVLMIVAAVKANNGEHYKYPFALRLVS
ncbi:MAG: DUF4870 domain-containing protein [Planctomycetota bacterium]